MPGNMAIAATSFEKVSQILSWLSLLCQGAFDIIFVTYIVVERRKKCGLFQKLSQEERELFWQIILNQLL
jgi:hypothetical protein